MKIALGSDHAGFPLKETIVDYLKITARPYKDFGVFSEESSDYPDNAAMVAQAVQSGEYAYGIIICGTGIGVSIAANKHNGIRAALCCEPYSARCAREHNDANVLAMGSRSIGPGLAISIVEAFLTTFFGGGRHSRRVDKITSIESQRS